MSDETKKVYCKNCEYRGALWGKDWQWCEGPHLKEEITGEKSEYCNKVKKRYDTQSARKIEFNSKGECPYFKGSLSFKVKKVIKNYLKI